MKKILVRGADTIGSFVLATPFYRELRKNFKDAYIVLCVKPLVYELAKNCPYVDKVIFYNCKNFLDKLKFIKNLKMENFDIVYLISGSFESALTSFLSGVKERIGYAHDKRRFLLTQVVQEKEKVHYIDYILNILESQGLKVEDRNPEIYVKDSKTKYDKFFLGKEKVIGLNLTAIGEKSRNWPKEYGAELIERLLTKNFKIILFGTKNDLDYGNYIKDRIRENNFINLVGKTSLVEFISLVNKCDCYVSVATGGIHIAAALGKNVIGLYCPGDDIGWKPIGKEVYIITKEVKCAPCNQHKMKYCKDSKCMKLITVEEVFNLIEKII